LQAFSFRRVLHGINTHDYSLPSAMRVVAWAYILVSPFAGIISFTGSVLLLRFVLSQHAKT